MNAIPKFLAATAEVDAAAVAPLPKSRKTYEIGSRPDIRVPFREIEQEDIKNTVKCRVNNIDNIQSWVVALSTEDKRADLIEKGTVFGKEFLDILDM
jgi:hypothetical protein